MTEQLSNGKSGGPGRIDRLCDGYAAMGSCEERTTIVEWLLAHGYDSAAQRIHAGEHQMVFPLLAAENRVVHDMTHAPDPPDPNLDPSDDLYEAKREGDAADEARKATTCQPS